MAKFQGKKKILNFVNIVIIKVGQRAIAQWGIVSLLNEKEVSVCLQTGLLT